MANHQQVAGLRATNSHKSALILRMVGVVPRDGQRVGENRNGVFEKDSVPAKITLRFRVIPLKAHRHGQRRSDASRKMMSITREQDSAVDLLKGWVYPRPVNKRS